MSVVGENCHLEGIQRQTVEYQFHAISLLIEQQKHEPSSGSCVEMMHRNRFSLQ
jgi:hypothetical protein